jgi:hypothetical protein
MAVKVMTMVILIVLNSALRFSTCHPAITQKACMGYAALDYDAFQDLPEDVRLSLVPVRFPKMVCLSSGGIA